MQKAKTNIGIPIYSVQQQTNSSSHRTYTPNKLATKLKGEKEEEKRLATFGCYQPKIVKTSSTKFDYNWQLFSTVAISWSVCNNESEKNQNEAPYAVQQFCIVFHELKKKISKIKT